MVAMTSIGAVVDLGGRVMGAGRRTAGRIGYWATAPLARTPDLDDGDLRGESRDEVVPLGPDAFVDVRVGDGAALTVAYERHGTGEPLVLLHGLGQDRHAWDDIAPLLAGEYEVIAIDLPGFGRSPDWPAGLPRDLPTTATVLGEVFAALGVERPHVVGHSLGGLIALRLAQDGLARSVLALAPAGFWNEAERRYAFTVLAAARRIARVAPDSVTERLSATAAGRAILAGMLYGDPARCPPGAISACMRALRDATGFEATLRAGRTRGRFTGQITGTPVTIAWGTHDRILPRWQARRAAGLLPRAALLWLPGCGHVPMNDAPELVVRLILRTTGATGADTAGETVDAAMIIGEPGRLVISADTPECRPGA